MAAKNGQLRGISRRRDNIKMNQLSVISRPSEQIKKNPKFVWDKKSGRYRYLDTGKFVGKDAVAYLTRKNIDLVQQELNFIKDQTIAGKMTLTEFQSITARNIKTLHIQQAILARGGSANFTSADRARVSAILQQESDRIIGITQKLKDGTLSKAQFSAQYNTFAKKSQISFEESVMQNNIENGMVAMRRLLGVTDKHCQSCLNYAARGIQPIGTLPLPMQACECRSNCKCRVVYYRSFNP